MNLIRRTADRSYSLEDENLGDIPDITNDFNDSAKKNEVLIKQEQEVKSYQLEDENLGDIPDITNDFNDSAKKITNATEVLIKQEQELKSYQLEEEDLGEIPDIVSENVVLEVKSATANITTHNTTLPVFDGIVYQPQSFDWKTGAFVAAEVAVGIGAAYYIGLQVNSLKQMNYQDASRIQPVIPVLNARHEEQAAFKDANDKGVILLNNIAKLANNGKAKLIQNALSKINDYREQFELVNDILSGRKQGLNIGEAAKNNIIPTLEFQQSNNANNLHLRKLSALETIRNQHSAALNILNENDALSLRDQINARIPGFLKPINKVITTAKVALDIFELGKNPSIEQALKTGADASNLYMLYNGVSKSFIDASALFSLFNGLTLFAKEQYTMGVKAILTSIANYKFSSELLDGNKNNSNILTKLLITNAIDLGVDAAIAFYNYVSSQDQGPTLYKELEAAKTYANLHLGGEFGEKVYEKIFKPAINNKYDVAENNAKAIKQVVVKSEDYNYDYCIETEDANDNQEFDCYNLQGRIIDHVIISQDNILVGVELLYSESV